MAGADPDVWGLRCPEGTGEGRRRNFKAEMREGDGTSRSIASQSRGRPELPKPRKIIILAYQFPFVKRQRRKSADKESESVAAGPAFRSAVGTQPSPFRWFRRG